MLGHDKLQVSDVFVVILPLFKISHEHLIVFKKGFLETQISMSQRSSSLVLIQDNLCPNNSKLSVEVECLSIQTTIEKFGLSFGAEF